jgi:ribonuclease D
LAHITEKILGKPLSKSDQISNWSRRPLRKFQITYAAMDAFVLVKLYEKMDSMLKSKGDDILNYIEETCKGSHPKKEKEDAKEEESKFEYFEEENETVKTKKPLLPKKAQRTQTRC